MSDGWLELRARVEGIETLAEIMGLLEWDAQTMQPAGATARRGVQSAFLAELHHARLTDPALGDLLSRLDPGEDPLRQASLRKLKRDHARAGALPGALVAALARARTDGFAAWMEARTSGRFSDFLPALERLVALSREEAACHAASGSLYDGLLENFDPGARVAEIRPMFARLEPVLQKLIADRPRDRQPLSLHVPEPALRKLNDRVLRAMGFRFEDGRLDDAQHPFTCGLHPQDVRLTTHLYCDDLLGTLGGTIHEGGHGLYEQGLPTAWAGTGLRAAAGAGMHESQSRFWENVIGRSEAFFQWFAPILDDELGGGGPSAAALYAAANRVEPSFIRVHADETTYNLHILLRFELEVALFEGQLSVADLPEAWNAGMVRLLGIRPPDLNQGVLQDVHWSSGLFGYFPSYTLGNLYAASFRAALETELPSVWDLVARGEFAPVLAWLREKVHVHGSRLDAPALFVAAVGDRDPVADLEAHLRQRIG